MLLSPPIDFGDTDGTPEDVRIFPPQVAGSFYPLVRKELTSVLNDCLSAAAAGPGRHVMPPARAIIAPHAAYQYSGVGAAAAWRPQIPLRQGLRRVVILAPVHRLSLRGAAIPGYHAIGTPMGVLPVDQEAREAVGSLPGVVVADGAFEGEHAIEMQLPLVSALFGRIPVFPVLAGDIAPAELDRILQALWGGDGTLVVVSSDLSHYRQEAAAREADLETLGKIEALDDTGLSGEQACGHRPVAALIRQARRLSMRATTLDYRNSASAPGGNSHRVVGYGAVAFHDFPDSRLSQGERTFLLDLVRRGIRHRIDTGRMASFRIDEDTPPRLRARRASFVTLTMGDGRLRGCTGSLAPYRPLVADALLNGQQAACADSRFPPLTGEELAQARIGISTLTVPVAMQFADEADLVRQLCPDRDGLILEYRGKRGVFLPGVWEQLPDPDRFLRGLKEKTGLAEDIRTPGTGVWSFRAETFQEHGPETGEAHAG